ALLYRALAGQDRVQPGHASLAVEAQRMDVELFLVAERGVKARPVEAGRLGEFVERGGGEAFFHEHRAHALKYVGGNEGARAAPWTLFGALRYFCTTSHDYP